ncbi:MAG: winged helix-turn-helix transcriptional regulator [Methanobacteriota archaeon]|nr:MAG: winged helix-turn-helix transcriptional regulator [Euryarchaeota archaeon]
MSSCRWRSLKAIGFVGLILLGLLIFLLETGAEPGIDFVVIRDAPNGGGTPVGNRTYVTGQSDMYYAAGYNNTQGYVKDVNSYWFSGDLNIISLTGDKDSPNVTITAVEYGTTKVFIDVSPAGNGSWFEAETGNLTVISDIDQIILRNQSGGGGEWFGDTTVIGETTFTVYAAGYNDTRGYLRDVPVEWSTSNSSLCPVGLRKSSVTLVRTHGEGTCKITGSYSPGVSNTTGTITVISDIDYIVIRDAANDGGSPVGNATYLLEQQDRYWAAGYNHTTGYRGDLRVFWTSNNDSVCTVTSSENTYTNVRFLDEGQCQVKINYAWLVWNSTGTISVLFDIDYLVIRDAPAGGGQPVIGKTLYVGFSYSFYAAGYNLTDGFRRDLGVGWTNSDSTVCKPTSVTQKKYRMEAWVPGMCSLTATYLSRVSNGTGNMSIRLDVDFLTIRDAPSGGGQPLGSKTLYAYLEYYFYAGGYNSSTGYLRDLRVTWGSSNNSLCPLYWAGEFAIKVIPTFPGICNITAEYRGLLSNRTGALTVLLDIDRIIIRDGPGGGGDPMGNRTYFTGQVARYYAAGYNDTTGYRRDLDSTWLSNNTTVCALYRPPAEIYVQVSFWAEGVCKISTSYHGLVSNSTGTLRVDWDIDYVVVVDAPNGGGNPVENRTYFLDSTGYFFAAGYNHTSDYRRDLKAAWENTNTTVCDITPLTNGSVRFHAESIGYCRISATYLNRISNSTGSLIVRSEIDYIIIRDSPGGGGSWVDDNEYIITSEHNFYAAGYNNTRDFITDLDLTWSTNNPWSCGLVRHGTYITFRARALGTCLVTADYHGILFNSTGQLEVIPKPVLIVDDDGTGDHLTIHEALEEAVDGTIIRVLNGTYFEHILVNKTVTIEGLDKSRTWVNGSGYGTVFLITANNVRITGLTIENSEYGIFLDHVDYASIDHNTIRWYEYGIYSNFSKRSHIEKNLVTEGFTGIVTYHSDNDAVWYNEISYNDLYGAKDYYSELSKCFNWNYFHHNKIAYYYDPDEDLEPLVLDSNVLEDNEIAILVEYSSSIHITNNTVLRGEKGVSVLDGSPFVGNNSFTNVAYGIELRNSSSYVFGNSITNTLNGIEASGGSPSIEGNVIHGTQGYALRLEDVNDASIISNDFGNGMAEIIDSSLNRIQVRNGTLQLVNSSWQDLEIGKDGVAEIRWWLSLKILSENGDPISGASLTIEDCNGNLVAELLSDDEGRTPLIVLTQKRISETLTLDSNPYRLVLQVDGKKQQFELTVDSSRFSFLYFEPSVKDRPWILYFLLALTIIATCFLPTMSIERSRYAVLSLFMLLYVKLKEEDILGQFTRGRIHGYIEANPGEHFGAIRKALSLSSGNAIYHLRVLEKEGLIVSRNDGVYKRFYPKGGIMPPDNGAPLSEIHQRILSCVGESAGISQKEIGNLLGLHQSTLAYQLQKLLKAGLIRRERVGGRVRYYSAKRNEK